MKVTYLKILGYEKKGFMAKGIVKWFNEHKGYGLIEDKSGTTLPVYYKEVKGGYLKEGDEVEFETEKDEKGTHAKGVKILKEAKS